MSSSGDKIKREAEHDERQFVAVHDDVWLASSTNTQDPAVIAPTSELSKIEDAPTRTSKFDCKLTNRPVEARPKKPNFNVQSFIQTQLAVEQAQGTWFVLIPILMIAGVTRYFTLPAEPAAHNIPVAIMAFLLLRWALRNAGLGKIQIVNAAIIFTFAMGFGQWRTMTVDTPMLGSAVSTNLTAQIRSIEQRANGSVRYTLDVISTQKPTLRYAPDRVRATTRTPVMGAEIGEGLRGYVRLQPPSGPVRPNGFDFAFNNYFQKIGANGFFLGQPEAIELNNSQWNPKIYVERSRLWLARHIRSQNQTRSGTVAAALITGDKAAIPKDVTEALRISGLAHILSISGLHMALVAGTVMFSLRAVFAVSPSVAARVPTKKYAALAGFGAIFIYLFLAGTSVATQRSFIMLAVMLGALLSDRSALTMRNLAIAAIVVLLIAPESALGPSFQMSFAATLALIAAYGAWTRLRGAKPETQALQTSLGQNLLRQSGGFIAGLSMTSIIAGTATGIFAFYHFQRVAVFGLLGNLLAMPIVSIITMPSAILATLLIPVGLDGYVYWVMNWSIEQVIQISTFVAAHSPSGAVGAMSPITLAYLAIGMIVLCVFRSKFKYLGLFFVFPAIVVQANLTKPLLVISEDARQVAVITKDGSLAVNRARPNSFILDQWKAGYKSNNIIKPNTNNGFSCHKDGYCRILILNRNINKTVLIIDKKEYFQLNKQDICARSEILILTFAPAPNTCNQSRASDKTPLIVTAQQLALYGSAEIRPDTEDPNLYVARHALGAAARPWQSHRKFSRPARNLAPIPRSNQ